MVGWSRPPTIGVKIVPSRGHGHLIGGSLPHGSFVSDGSGDGTSGPQAVLPLHRVIAWCLMVRAVHRVIRVEKIRDGGSLAATFTSEGSKYILFIRLQIVFHGLPGSPGHIERLGFDQPVLIDCDPKKRPADTDQVIHSELSGPSFPVSWSEARELLRSISGLSAGLNRIESDWLREMVNAASHEGCEFRRRSNSREPGRPDYRQPASEIEGQWYHVAITSAHSPVRFSGAARQLRPCEQTFATTIKSSHWGRCCRLRPLGHDGDWFAQDQPPKVPGEL